MVYNAVSMKKTYQYDERRRILGYKKSTAQEAKETMQIVSDRPSAIPALLSRNLMNISAHI